jgi:hypothetical protein
VANKRKEGKKLFAGWYEPWFFEKLEKLITAGYAPDKTNAIAQAIKDSVPRERKMKP